MISDYASALSASSPPMPVGQAVAVEVTGRHAPVGISTDIDHRARAVKAPVAGSLQEQNPPGVAVVDQEVGQAVRV